MRNTNECIMSGFHTKLEGDIYDLLLNGETCLIEVCADGVAKEFAVRQTRIDRAGPFIREKRRQTKAQAHACNIFVLHQAQKVIIGYATHHHHPRPSPL